MFSLFPFVVPHTLLSPPSVLLPPWTRPSYTYITYVSLLNSLRCHPQIPIPSFYLTVLLLSVKFIDLSTRTKFSYQSSSLPLTLSLPAHLALIHFLFFYSLVILHLYSHFFICGVSLQALTVSSVSSYPSFLCPTSLFPSLPPSLLIQP